MSFNPDKAKIAASEKEKTPPLKWFDGAWAFGQVKVFFSDELTGMGEGKVGEALQECSHINRAVIDGKLEDREPPAERSEIVAKAEKLVFEATGFTADELILYKVKISAHFKGKTMDEAVADQQFPIKIELPPEHVN